MRILAPVWFALFQILIHGSDASAEPTFPPQPIEQAKAKRPGAVSHSNYQRERPFADDREDAIAAQVNSWTIGVAAGQLEGASLRFAAELARVLEDEDNMHVLPIVTRGTFDNVYNLLYLRGVDAAIINGDVLEHFKNNAKIGGLEQRINYIMPLFPSEVHILVRPEIKRLEDLAGKRVNFNTKGTASAYSGPVVFDRLGIKVDAQFAPHPAAFAEMAQSDKYAAVVFISSKPLDAFLKATWPEGFKFLGVPLRQNLEEFYLPAQLEAGDYPGLVPKGQKIQTIAVPSLLAVLDLPPASERGRRISRFIDYLFERFPKLQNEAGYHPKWKDINLAANVPGWKRYAAMQDRLNRQITVRSSPNGAAELNEQLERMLPNDKSARQKLLQELLARSR